MARQGWVRGVVRGPPAGGGGDDPRLAEDRGAPAESRRGRLWWVEDRRGYSKWIRWQGFECLSGEEFFPPEVVREFSTWRTHRRRKSSPKSSHPAVTRFPLPAIPRNLSLRVAAGAEGIIKGIFAL